MNREEILDRIVVPRPNGSETLAEVARFLEEALRASGAEVSLHAFTATPHGFQLVWSAGLALMLLYATAAWQRRWGAALALACCAPLLLLAEFELLRSPVSGLAPHTEHNVVGTFPGRPDGPTLVFSAHYDSTTHFGDHYSWGPWGWRLGPATGLAIGLALLGLALRRRGREVPRGLGLSLGLVAAVPMAAMWWFHAAGPLLREPSPGAVDNAGSVAALLELAGSLGERDADAPTTLRIVFFAAEEERALGSWAYAATLAGRTDLAVVNLESVGARGELAWITEDGFELRRFHSPPALLELGNGAAREALGRPLPERRLPAGVLTDGRSFLAHGVPAITLRALEGGEFPRRLHSAHDARERLSAASIERAVALLETLVRQVDARASLELTPLPARR